MFKINKKYILFLVTIISLFINTKNILFNTIIYSLSVIPLAVLLGDFTSKASDYIGEKKGGLLAATLGNMPELMMGLWSIKYGLIPMVKSALIGSIINNMLLVLGISIFLGGIKYKEQDFNKTIARTNFNMLLLAMSAMVVMASLNRYASIGTEKIISISLKVAIVLILIYLLGLIFSLFTHSNLFIVSEEKEQQLNKNYKELGYIVAQIISISIVLFIASEKLINSISILVIQFKLSQSFIGIMLIPLLGNIGENISAIMCAVKNKINMSLEIAIGSSIQISLFVTPLFIIYSFIIGIPMTFLFTVFQIIISAVAIGMSFIVFVDGKTYWLEGAILIAIYLMVTIAYYYV